MENKKINNLPDDAEGASENQSKSEMSNGAIRKNNASDKKKFFSGWFILPILLLILILLSLVFYKTGVFQSLKDFVLPKNAPFFFPPEPPDGSKILEETGSMKNSSSHDWWLNSGGVMRIDGNIFSTNIGSLPKDNAWRRLYAKSNQQDTDDGYYPQNIFRLVTRKKWQNLSQILYFNIEKTNASDSKYRNESNGILLFNRYQDGDNLYYAGIRVDGQAVIKKKIGGKYYTLAEKPIFSGDKKYERSDNPNLLPQNTWLGIRSDLVNAEGGAVEIRLYLDREEKNDWQLILDAKDKGNDNGQAPFLNEGYAGIRTDFMDVKFKKYGIQKI